MWRVCYHRANPSRLIVVPRFPYLGIPVAVAVAGANIPEIIMCSLKQNKTKVRILDGSLSVEQPLKPWILYL